MRAGRISGAAFGGADLPAGPTGGRSPWEEFPLAQTLVTGETVRAEEIVLKAPDGRSVTALVNATPIPAQEGEVESVVITIQDLTPLEELERLRAEFLGMVSHELRTPLAAIKGSADTLLENAADLDPAEMTQFFRIIRDQSESMRHLIGDLLDVARIETGSLPVSPEPVEVIVAGGRGQEPVPERGQAGPTWSSTCRRVCPG